MRSQRTRTLMMMWILIIAVGGVLAITTVSFADEVSLANAVTILPAAHFAADVSGSFRSQEQTPSMDCFTMNEVDAVTTHFGGTYRPFHLQTMSIVVNAQVNTLFANNIWLNIINTASLGIMPQLSMDYTQQGTFAAYGFTIQVACATTINQINLSTETADMHVTCSETLGAEFWYPRMPSYPDEVLPGLNIAVGGNVRYPWAAPHAWLTVTAHTSDADLAAITEFAVGKTSPRTTLTAAVRMGAITLNGNTSLLLVPYRVTSSTAQATLRWNGFSFAVAGTLPPPSIKVTIGYQFQV